MEKVEKLNGYKTKWENVNTSSDNKHWVQKVNTFLSTSIASFILFFTNVQPINKVVPNMVDFYGNNKFTTFIPNLSTLIFKVF